MPHQQDCIFMSHLISPNSFKNQADDKILKEQKAL